MAGGGVVEPRAVWEGSNQYSSILDDTWVACVATFVVIGAQLQRRRHSDGKLSEVAQLPHYFTCEGAMRASGDGTDDWTSHELT